MAGVFVPIDDLAMEGVCDGDGGRAHGGLGGLFLTADDQQQC